MHYIEQCLEPGRILNYIDSISSKREMLNSCHNLKQAGMIELQLTDKCNLNCFHCHFRNKGDIFFDGSWIDFVLNDISPKAISLAGGGEPTLYPDFDKTIKKLKNGKSSPEIGLITNGVLIPEGNLPSLLSWLRVSLYSVIDNQYAGRDSSVQQMVISNIEKYMNMANIKMLGVSLLYYNGNVIDCIKLSFVLYKMLKASQRGIEKFNLQFKRAFVLSDPRKLDKDTYNENVSLIPEREELFKAVKYKEQLCAEDLLFEAFLNQCSNYKQIEDFLTNGREIAINQLNPSEVSPHNFSNCYVVLENRLVTPDGYVYSCPSIAENREKELALGHILDENDVYFQNILKYYNCSSEWCNKRFCRHVQHNELVQRFLEREQFYEFGREILEDSFF